MNQTPTETQLAHYSLLLTLITLYCLLLTVVML